MSALRVPGNAEQQLTAIALAAARLDATERAGEALLKNLSAPPEHGKITLAFAKGKLYRVVREESF